MTIVCTDINKQKAKKVAEKSKSYAVKQNYHAISFAVNITSFSSVQQMIKLMIKELKHIDHCVNAAKINSFIIVSATTCLLFFLAKINNEVHEIIYDSFMKKYENVLNINAKDVMTCIRAVIKFMLNHKSRFITSRNETRDIDREFIVNLNSANSYAALFDKVAYVTFKHVMMRIIKIVDKSRDSSASLILMRFV